MAYKRKTRDEYEVQGNYGYGWDLLTTEATLSEAKRIKREYIANDKQLIAITIIKKRVPLNT